MSTDSRAGSGSAAQASAVPLAWQGFTALSADGLMKLRELDPSGGNGLLQRVMKAYEESASRLVAQLLEGLKADDAAAIRQASHTLKSASASIGAVKFSGVCADIEATVRNGALPDATRSIEEVTRLFDQVLAEVRVILK